MVLIELVPPDCAGGVRIGESWDQIRVALFRYGEVESVEKTTFRPSLFVYAHDVGLGIFVYFDRSGRAEAIELGRPVAGVEVLYGGVDVSPPPLTS